MSLEGRVDSFTPEPVTVTLAFAVAPSSDEAIQREGGPNTRMMSSKEREAGVSTAGRMSEERPGRAGQRGPRTMVTTSCWHPWKVGGKRRVFRACSRSAALPCPALPCLGFGFLASEWREDAFLCFALPRLESLFTAALVDKARNALAPKHRLPGFPSRAEGCRGPDLVAPGA